MNYLADELMAASRAVGEAWLDVWGLREQPPALAQTPRDEVALDGRARLYHFIAATPPSGPTGRPPILVVPSLINRWYVLDLRPRASLVEALVGAGFDVWLLDWGGAEPEDRYLEWDAVVARIDRAARRVLRATAASRIALLGYCMGGTLTAIHAALHPQAVAALALLAAPIDFARAGMLRRMVDPAWFDADAIADAGNVAASQMQAGFVALRPTLDAQKAAGLPDLVADRAAREAFLALDAWASDNVAFPAAAYRRYIRDLYQGNQLVTGGHRVAGVAVSLQAITCPVVAITASRDTICPPAAATAMLDLVSSTDKTTIEVPGGHVGAVVGSRASSEMYPRLVEWFRRALA